MCCCTDCSRMPCIASPCAFVARTKPVVAEACERSCLYQQSLFVSIPGSSASKGMRLTWDSIPHISKSSALANSRWAVPLLEGHQPLQRMTLR